MFHNQLSFRNVQNPSTPLPDTSGEGIKWGFLIFLSNFSAFLVLFIFRSADDNRLTNWEWVFSDVQIWIVFLFLISGIVIAYVVSRMTFPEHKPVLFLFISAFAVSILFWGEPEVIVDASRYFTQAKHLEMYGINYFFREWGRGLNAWTDLPVVPFLYGLIFKFFGESRMYIQIFTSLLFSMTCVITYFIGKTLWNKDTGFYGGLLLMGIPYLLTQVPLMLVDIPTMFFLTLSIYTFINVMERGRTWIAAASVVIFLTVFTKYSTWLMLSVLFVIFLVYLKNKKTTRKEMVRRIIVVAYITGILITVLLIFKFTVISEQIKFLREYQMPGLRRWGESFVSTFFYQTHPLITAAALYSFFAAFRRRDLQFIIIAWLLFIVVMLQIQRARYLMITFPMLTLMASYGFQKIKNIEMRKCLVFSIVILSLIMALTLYLPFLKKMDTVNLKDAGRFLDSIDELEIEVLTLPAENSEVNPAVAVPVLDYFTRKRISYDYEVGAFPSFESIKESPLRFTWEYRNPGYYNASIGLSRKPVFAVISNGPAQTLPDYIEKRLAGYKKTKVFKTSLGLFRYSPVVMVYQPS